MPTGVLIAPDRHAANVVDDALSKARLAREPVWNKLWLGQQFDYDAIPCITITFALVDNSGQVWSHVGGARRGDRDGGLRGLQHLPVS
jgi:hypothetical protein